MESPGRGDPIGSASDVRVQAAFAEEELHSLRLLTRVRLITLAVIAMWLPAENPYPAILFYYGLLLAFAVIGVAPLALRRARLDAPWQRYLFPLLDVGLFTLAVSLPNPLDPEPFPAQMRLRFGNEVYLLVFLTASVFTYSPRVVLVTGVGAAVAWSVATLSILSLPHSHGIIPAEDLAHMTAQQRLGAVLDPYYVNLGLWGRQVVVILVAAGSLATAVSRSRRLVLRQVAAERERGNLSRYFSPNMVEELARSDEPLRVTRTQNVAVLFADIVGFTKLSAAQPPEKVVELLRELHRRLARAVFDHRGTLDKYLGDGVMATFGTPRTSPHDASNALRCTRAMVRLLAAWNRERAGRGEFPIRVGVGVHYGQVVLGDIGDEQHLEFAVLGDTVNVASRLEHLTRETGTQVLVSHDVVEAARAEGTPESGGLRDFREIAPQEIRGRDGVLRVWTLTETQGGC